MTNETELVEVPTTAIDQATKALGDLFGAEDKTASKAEKASEEARQARDNSIRNLPEKLGGILSGTNYAFEDSVVNPDQNDDGFGKKTVTLGELLAHRVAKRLAGGKTKTPVYNSRKSELRLMIDTRDEIEGMIEALDEHVKKVQEEDDGDYSLNIRQTVLSGLRKIRKDTTGKVTPETVVQEIEAKRTYVASPQEKATKALENLSGMEAFSGKDKDGNAVMDDRAEEAFRALMEVIEQGPDVEGTLERAAAATEQTVEQELDSLYGEQEPEPEQESDDDFEQWQGSAARDPEVDIEEEVPFEVEDDDEDDDELDIDALMRGVQ